MKIKRRSPGKKFFGIFLALVLFLFLYVWVPAAAWGRSSNSVDIKDGFMNADLYSVPLKTVLQNIKLSNNFEYKGEEDILNEKITIRFNNLSVENGLKRILSKFNYSITYQSDGTPVSVYIYGKKGDKTGNIRSSMVDRPSQQDINKNIKPQASNAEQIEPRQFKTTTVAPKTLGKVMKVPATNRAKSIDADRHRY